MTKIQSLIKHLKNKPNDLKYDDVRTILNHLGYKEYNKGKTSGSRVRFYHQVTGSIINMHKPHGKKCMSKGAVDDLVNYLSEKGEI